MTGTIIESCDQFKSVGKIRRAHGIRGELFLISFSKNFDWLEDVNEATLVKREEVEEGNFKEVRYQFPINKAKTHKVGRILKLDGITDRNLAESFEGAVFQVPQGLFETTESSEDFYLLQLKDFDLIDQEQELRGKVSAFGNNGAQDLLVISTAEGNEFEVPYVESWIKQLDFTEKKIVMKKNYWVKPVK